MKRISLLPTLALLGLLLTAPAVQASPPTSPFAGTWYGHDPAPDSSLLQLDVSGGARAQIVFTDYFGSICVNVGSPDTVFTAKLLGTVSGDTLDATWISARCGPVYLPFIKGGTLSFGYSDSGTSAPSDDTLFDGFTTWTRVP